MKFWQCWDVIIPYQILWELLCKQGVPYSKNEKFYFFHVKTCSTINPPTSNILWREAKEDGINIYWTDLH